MKIKALNKQFDLVLENIAADKSISHRAALFSLLTNGECKVKNYLYAQDCLHTLEVVRNLGATIKIYEDKNELVITPPNAIKSPNVVLDCGNSGTLMRLLIGFLASQDGFFVLSGDEYLNKRPMKRVSDILNKLGAKIDGREGANYAPLAIRGEKIDYFTFENTLKSAQVKTALILAGLLSNGCEIYESELSRDHSENLLKMIKAPIKTDGSKIEVKPLQDKLQSYEIEVPNDPSSAFFFAVLCAISDNSTLVLKNMLLNKTRIEAFKILEKMGANITYQIEKNDYENIGTITIKSSKLKAVEVSENISWLIDEIPALSIAFLYAEGNSIVKNAKELRVKESDRIKAVLENYSILGVEYEEFEDGFMVVGKSIKNNNVMLKSFADHRIAMSFSLLAKDYEIEIDNVECVDASFTNFYEILSLFERQ
ncbi:3-phosphoshikimate 1-carboxyvinyltransferase [Campylobacter sp. RM12637]|uniref:3-phosphoshikimate 1-carboxyvinyltransferase n=1 Tax=Campylobacter sp. RM12637 TaxID=2735734 RepID=UPI0030148C6A|nr:3-phosphoshikimate 1-carboxyvinyltransferase [Campylobacter sp. RM12637]